MTTREAFFLKMGACLHLAVALALKLLAPSGPAAVVAHCGPVSVLVRICPPPGATARAPLSLHLPAVWLRPPF